MTVMCRGTSVQYVDKYTSCILIYTYLYTLYNGIQVCIEYNRYVHKHTYIYKGTYVQNLQLHF